MMVKPYRPHPPTAAILDRALELVKSVPYQVSLRWLFYGLLQEGVFQSKSDYITLKGITAKARKRLYNGWNPNTLADDTRQAYTRGTGYFNEADFLEAIGESRCVLDKWQGQDYYVELWYEAKAMHGQFAHYTKHITLRPFGGDPSIHYKWGIAKDLEQAHQTYGLPVVILYFGDLDRKGFTIPENAVCDIREWCDVGFNFIRAGLNDGDEVRYNIPENPERPGSYQWEALSDTAAKKLITGTVERFVGQGIQTDTEDQEREITSRFRESWREFIEGGLT